MRATRNARAPARCEETKTMRRSAVPPHSPGAAPPDPTRPSPAIRSKMGGPSRRSAKGGWTPEEVRRVGAAGQSLVLCFFLLSGQWHPRATRRGQVWVGGATLSLTTSHTSASLPCAHDRTKSCAGPSPCWAVGAGRKSVSAGRIATRTGTSERRLGRRAGRDANRRERGEGDRGPGPGPRRPRWRPAQHTRVTHPPTTPPRPRARSASGWHG